MGPEPRRFLRQVGPDVARGRIRQSPNPYSIDAVLRIVHTLVLAREGGFLVHAASAVRNGRAFFSPVCPARGRRRSPAWRHRTPRCSPTSCHTCARKRTDTAPTAPRSPASWPRRRERPRAPGGGVPAQAGRENRIEDISTADAARALLRNVLFFAKDSELVQAVFHSACELVERVPVRRLTFLPDARVWELIQ